MRLLIIGGSDAGISAALRAREVAPDSEVTVVVADAYPNFSICGLPYYLSSEVPDWRSLAHRTRAEIEALGITLLLNHTATAIDSARKTVQIVRTAQSAQSAVDDGSLESVQAPGDEQGKDSVEGAYLLAYDRLIIATGARPQVPAIAGLHQEGVYLLHTMADSFALQRHLDYLDALDRLTNRQPEHHRARAVIIGAGYIGLEMAEALTTRGLATTLLQRGAHIHPSVDPAFSERLAAELGQHGVQVLTQTQV